LDRCASTSHSSGRRRLLTRARMVSAWASSALLATQCWARPFRERLRRTARPSRCALLQRPRDRRRAAPHHRIEAFGHVGGVPAGGFRFGTLARCRVVLSAPLSGRTLRASNAPCSPPGTAAPTRSARTPALRCNAPPRDGRRSAAGRGKHLARTRTSSSSQVDPRPSKPPGCGSRHLRSVLSCCLCPVARTADALEVAERLRVSALAERNDVVDLLGGALVADVAERVAGWDRSTGSRPLLALEGPLRRLTTLSASPALDRPIVAITAALGTRIAHRLRQCGSTPPGTCSP
jgi:hypothetical protein